MNLSDVKNKLPAENIVAGEDEGMARAIGGVVASDLMSDVLVSAKEDCLLVTSLASEQMIRTADLVGAVGVLVVNGKPLPPSLVSLARSLAMPLLRTRMPKYETCLALAKAGCAEQGEGA